MKKQILLLCMVVAAVNASAFGMFRGCARLKAMGTRFSATNAMYGFRNHAQAHEEVMRVIHQFPCMNDATQVKALAFLQKISQSKQEYRSFVDQLETKRKQASALKQINAIKSLEQVEQLILRFKMSPGSCAQKKEAVIKHYKDVLEETKNGGRIAKYLEVLAKLEKANAQALKQAAELQKKLDQRPMMQKMYDYCCGWFKRS